MKGLILVAGKGKRMHSISSNKCLSIVDGKSLIAHNIERLLSMGIYELIIVVGSDSEKIKKHIKSFKDKPSITYIEQKTPLGIVDAIKCAVPSIGNDDFVLCLGDEIFYHQKPKEMLGYFISSDADCLCGIILNETENEIKKCYSVLLDETNSILDLTEKPEKPFNNHKGTGFCIFKNRTLDWINLVKPNIRSGQYELCDWIRTCIAKGMKCKTFDFADKEFNINTYEDLLTAKEKLESY
jgi:dTDP-glucose pyrophosphorylase